MSRKKETFKPLIPGKVSMHTCGPTAHTRLRIGECRRYVFSDLLYRYLKYRGYDVYHIINITDIDDKTIAGSEQAEVELAEFTKKHTQIFKEDLETLGNAPADLYPCASDHVDDMVRLTEKLVQKGYAYEKLRSLYFDISRFSDYGALSGIDLDKIRLGATVDLDEYEKDNPRDFTLLKRSKLSELKRGIFVSTPWGKIRPSWHMQCSAMSSKYLGEQYDIQTSSRELIFPHHENKIAISGALTGKIPAKFWVHCERVQVNGKTGNATGQGLTLVDLLEMGYTGREIRYWLLAYHYRKPISFSTQQLEGARRSLKRINACMYTLENINPDDGPYGEIDQLIYDIKNGFVTAMDDDLNISAALASIFKSIRVINRLCLENAIGPDDAVKIFEAFNKINSVLNIIDDKQESSDQRVQELIQLRKKARAEKNWGESDRIRSQLQALGVTVRDVKA